MSLDLRSFYGNKLSYVQLIVKLNIYFLLSLCLSRKYRMRGGLEFQVLKGVPCPTVIWSN